MLRLPAGLAILLLTTAALAADPSPERKTEAEPAPPAGAPIEGNLERKCEAGADRRLITVVPKDAGCEVHYVKRGQSSIAASYQNGTEGCDRVQANIAKNLIAAGYTCR